MQVRKTTILKDWPEDKSRVSPLVTPYCSIRDELSIYDGLIFKGERLVEPETLRAEIKKELHASHAGVEGCLRRARESVYWRTMNSELRHWISTCEPCRMIETSHGKETLMSHEIPQRPWEKVAVDLLTLDQKDYLVVVDNIAATGSLKGYVAQIREPLSRDLRVILLYMAAPAN